jgi:hypothetical protein
MHRIQSRLMGAWSNIRQVPEYAVEDNQPNNSPVVSEIVQLIIPPITPKRKNPVSIFLFIIKKVNRRLRLVLCMIDWLLVKHLP